MATSVILGIILMIAASISAHNYCKVDRDNTGCPSERPVPLHHQVCCLVNNVAKTIHMTVNDQLTIVICPAMQPRSCPVYENCVQWFEKGYTISGEYTIRKSDQNKSKVYCDMEGINCDDEGDWTRVAYINMTEPNATCPNGLTKLNYSNIDHPLCGRESVMASCASTTFSSNGLTYSKVCGQVRGYQYGSPDGFNNNNNNNIESYYVDGVSITHEINPRKHIWTYAASVNDNDKCTCPCCTGDRGSTAATFVGSHYYCESGNPTPGWKRHFLYSDDPLWDGQQCNGREAPCCPDNSTMPWFYRSLDTQTSDYIELRVCCNQDRNDEAIYVDIIELYVK